MVAFTTAHRRLIQIAGFFVVLVRDMQHLTGSQQSYLARRKMPRKPTGQPTTHIFARLRQGPHPTPLRTRRRPTGPTGSPDRDGARPGALKGG